MKTNLYAAGFSHGQQGWQAKHPNSPTYMRGFTKGEAWVIRDGERDLTTQHQRAARRDHHARPA